jgi:dihydroorotate dehydrogenase
MAPASGVAVEAPIRFVSPVVLTKSIDPQGIATRAFAQFEVGAIEVEAGAGVDSKRPSNSVVIIEYFGAGNSSEADVIRCAPSDADAAVNSGARMVVVELEGDTDEQTARDLIARGIKAFVVEGADGADVRARVGRLRQSLGQAVLIAAGGFITSPRDALELRRAGADLLLVGEGLAVAGPGLPKRINDALLTERHPAGGTSMQRNWISGSLFGAGVIVAALIATWVALTSVIMQYDEQFIGMARHELQGVNANLLDFMAHDRLSYAGATLSLGILYFSLAAFGLRRREQWAFHAFTVTGIAGFATFFLYIGFDYLDIGNAAVNVVLLPFFLAAVVKFPAFNANGSAVDRDNDDVWRRALTGQLLLVALGFGLIIGGLMICIVGITNVFVVSDLAFLDTTSHHLQATNDRLLPLIAHDRVSFGGAIVCNGVAVLLMSMWGFRRGERWLWWSLLIAGSTNLGFTLYAHFSTDYTEFGHLLPVGLGAVFFIGGLALSRAYFFDRQAGEPLTELSALK